MVEISRADYCAIVKLLDSSQRLIDRLAGKPVEADVARRERQLMKRLRRRYGECKK